MLDSFVINRNYYRYPSPVVLLLPALGDVCNRYGSSSPSLGLGVLLGRTVSFNKLDKRKRQDLWSVSLDISTLQDHL